MLVHLVQHCPKFEQVLLPDYVMALLAGRLLAMTRGSRLLHSNVVPSCLIPTNQPTDFSKLRHHHFSSCAIYLCLLAAVYEDSQA
jgi:hypothetical protein